MTLIINGEDREIAAGTLAALVETLGLQEAKIATALNGTFVSKAARPKHALREGDRVEIVAPMQGG